MEELTEKMLKRFDSKPRVWDNFEFFGMQIKTLAPSSFSIGQESYTKQLQIVPSDASFEFLRSFRARFAWISHTRPEMAGSINKAVQVTPKTFGKDKISQINKAIKRLKDTASISLIYGRLEKKSLQLRVCMDASFEKNDDLSSQLGFIVLICDASNRAHILDYSSRKSKRVVRFILGDQIYALAEGFDRAFML